MVSELIIGRRVKQPAVVPAAPILDAGQRIRGVGTVSLRLDQRELNDRHRMQLAAFVTIALLALAGPWTLTHWLSGRVSRLVEQTRTVGRGELGQRGPISSAAHEQKKLTTPLTLAARLLRLHPSRPRPRGGTKSGLP